MLSPHATACGQERVSALGAARPQLTLFGSQAALEVLSEAQHWFALAHEEEAGLLAPVPRASTAVIFGLGARSTAFLS